MHNSFIFHDTHFPTDKSLISTNHRLQHDFIKYNALKKLIFYTDSFQINILINILIKLREI